VSAHFDDGPPLRGAIAQDEERSFERNFGGLPNLRPSNGWSSRKKRAPPPGRYVRKEMEYMGFQEKSGYCSHCNKNVLVRAQTPNHVLHLVLSIVTGGFWIIVWIILCIRVKEWHCSQCGQRILASFGDNAEVIGSHTRRIKECSYCGAKNRSEDYTCISCGKPLL
jgi:DNA-directed RNA polymerase subunit RPC12/RpoP